MIRNYFKEVMAMTEILWVTLVGGLIAFLQALILANLKAVNKKVTDMCADNTCLLYTSDDADELLCLALGGWRIVKYKREPHSLIHRDSL